MRSAFPRRVRRFSDGRRLLLALGLLVSGLALAQADGGTAGPMQVPLEALPRLELAAPDGGVFAPRQGPVVMPEAPPTAPGVTPPPGAPTLQPEGPPRITELRILGNERVPRDRVVGALTQTVGEPFSQRKAAEDLRRLFALGEFSDVELEVEKAGGGLAYIIRLTELPVLNEVRVEKVTQLREEDLVQALNLKPGAPISESGLREARARAEQRLESEGFDQTEVELRTEPVEGRNAVNVNVEVHERPRVRVGRVEFKGAAPERVDDLRREITFRKASLLSNLLGTSVFTRERLDAAADQLRTWYLNRGFASVQVAADVELTDEGTRADITFDIDEGVQYRIHEVRITGEVPLSEEEVRKHVTAKLGDLLSRDALLVQANALQTALQNEGYACALVVPDVKTDPASETAQVTLDVRPGAKVEVGQIRVAGNTETKEYVVRRSLSIRTGDPFSANSVQESITNLRNLGFLEDVRMSLPEGCVDGRADLLVSVKEGKSTGYQLSLGFASTERIIGTGRFIERNLFGTGRAISAFAQLSALRSDVAVSYLEPFVLGTDVDLAVQAAHNRFQYPDFLRRATGGSAYLNWRPVRIQPALRPLSASFGYGYQSVSVLKPPEIPPDLPQASLFRQGHVSSLSLGVGWNRNQETAFVLTGPLAIASIELSPDWLGASLTFVRYTASARWNIGSLDNVLFRVRGTFGWIDAIGSLPVPVSERYFVGGVGSLRGYKFRTISPVIFVPTETGLEEIRVGGIWQVLTGAELEFPLVPPLRVNLVLFYDAGNAFGEDTGGVFDMRRELPLGLFHSVGAGLRWYSPIGPVRLELAVPLDRRPGDVPQTVEIAIGVLP